MFEIIFNHDPGYPPAYLRIAGGPANEVSLTGAELTPRNGSLASDTLQLAPAVSWPLRIAFVDAAGDTLGSGSATTTLESTELTTVYLFFSANQGGIWGPCAPTLARFPVHGPNPVADTLYMTSWGPAPPGSQFPVC